MHRGRKVDIAKQLALPDSMQMMGLNSDLPIGMKLLADGKNLEFVFDKWPASGGTMKAFNAFRAT